MTLDDLRHWMESDELQGDSPVIADVDGLLLPIEGFAVLTGRLIIVVDMYNGRDYEAQSAWRRKEEGEE